METSDLEKAIHAVLPALNLEPAGFQLDRGFLLRAQRSARPIVMVLNNVASQFVFVGLRETSDPDSAVGGIAEEALGCLPKRSRDVCERLFVAWIDTHDRVFAAALVVASPARVGKILGVSWSPPEAWPEPMIDASKSGAEALANALARLEATIRRRSINSAAFDSDLSRASRLVDIALLRHGGEGQNTSAHPPRVASDESWSEWFHHYNHSVRSEWDRVQHAARVGTPGTTGQSTSGPLSGFGVFLSYARPDATALAWPVYEALRSSGADVWFDQEREPDESQLAQGFAETIGRCDAYIMCGSDEFFERAGYATQELAWALEHRAFGGKTRHFLVVARPDSVLPTRIASWPQVTFYAGDRERLARTLLRHLQQPAPDLEVESLPRILQPAPVSASPLPREADLVFQRRRAKHVLRFDEIDYTALPRLFSSNAEDDQQLVKIREQLLQMSEGLDWSGTLEDLDSWPDDPAVRDIRFRLAAVRAVLGTRWPLNVDLGSSFAVAPDVEYLASRPIPVFHWPTMPGWDDTARRFAIRHHAGILRILSELLRRGLDGGLLDVPIAIRDEWKDEVEARRRECVDTVLAMRLDARLSWKVDPPQWDAFFRAWRDFLRYPGREWRQPIPFSALHILSANSLEIAAIAAETGWHVSRHGGMAAERFTAKTALTPGASVEVYAAGPQTAPPPDISEELLRVGLVALADGGAEICVSWQGSRYSDDGAGATSAPAPRQLDRAINLLRN